MVALVTLTIHASSDDELKDALQDILSELESADNPAVINMRDQVAYNLRVLETGDPRTGTHLTPEQDAERQQIYAEAVRTGVSVTSLKRRMYAQREPASFDTPDGKKIELG